MNKKQVGFSLVEIMIVIVITATIATMMLTNFRNVEKSKRVQLTADGVTNVVRLAQNYTLGGKQIQRTSGCSGDNTVNDYRVVLTGLATSTTIYADDKCDTEVSVETFTYLNGARVQANGIAYEVCNPICSVNNVGTLHVRFTPPFARMTASTDGLIFTPFARADVTIESTDGTLTKVFRIDGVSGRIGN
jgi:prepilin-type N-terminal cleavage/methylation domain-containing protein